jgi:hypothetical protein
MNSRLKKRAAGYYFVVQIVCVIYLANGAHAAGDVEELPLPAWVAEGEGRLGPQVELSLLPEVTPASADENPDNPFKLFIPRSKTAAPTKEPLVTLRPLAAEFLSLSENADSESFLLDPQRLLSETQTEDLQRLLSYHASGSKITAYLLLLNKDQILPSDFDVSKLASGALLQKTSCLLVYSLGQPTRARFFMSKEIGQTAPAGQLTAMAQDCIRGALQVSDEVEQIQRFATQLSIRLFWLERACKLGDEVMPAKLSNSPEVSNSVDLLPEVTNELLKTDLLPDYFIKWKRIGIIVLAVIASLFVFFVASIAIWRWKQKQARRTVWLLPEIPDHPLRFGGPHGGGCGATVDFG